MPIYFLRSNVVAEPIMNRWYAWSMLLSPATSALIAANAHYGIMQSYLKMPKMHAAAVKNERMRGGPFIDFNGDMKLDEVQSSIRYLEEECAHILEFAKALQILNQLILESADGHSLIPLYDRIPDILRGYVELIYDANNRPGYRLLESLLYRSRYYHEAGQEIMLSTIHGDYRAFVLSTPRLPTENTLAWKIPFADKCIDDFFALREHGQPKQEIERIYNTSFEKTPKNHDLFWSLMTDCPPSSDSSYRQYNGPGVRLRYFGHACVLIETQHTNIMIDCMISYNYETEIPRFTFDDLPERIDYVLLTHSHQDHVLLEHLLQLRYKIEHIVVPKNVTGSIQDPSLKLMFKHLQFKNVIEMDEMDNIALRDGEIIGLPFFGEHGDLYINSKLAYLVKIQNKSILFLADSNNIEPVLYEHLQQLIPKIDVIFLGMECDGAPMSWLYGPILGTSISRSMDQSRRLNGSCSNSALGIIRQFDCSQVYIYAMGQEPWLGYITSIEYTSESRPLTESDRLIKLCQAEGRLAERPYAKKEIYLSE